MFPAPEGGYLHSTSCRRRFWTPAVERAGLVPLRLHALRHTCASLAIAAGADVNAASNDGTTPLMSAARLNSNPQVSLELLNAGAFPKTLDAQGKTALDWALENDSMAGSEALQILEKVLRP